MVLYSPHCIEYNTLAAALSTLIGQAVLPMFSTREIRRRLPTNKVTI
jgi:hypothetical protein